MKIVQQIFPKAQVSTRHSQYFDMIQIDSQQLFAQIEIAKSILILVSSEDNTWEDKINNDI